jgi:hypothetical protein
MSGIDSAAATNASGLSEGAKVGVGIGISVCFIGLVCLLVTWLRLRGNRNQPAMAPLAAPLYAKPELDSTVVPVYKANSGIQYYEIGPSRNTQPSVAELE